MTKKKNPLAEAANESKALNKPVPFTIEGDPEFTINPAWRSVEFAHGGKKYLVVKANRESYQGEGCRLVEFFCICNDTDTFDEIAITIRFESDDAAFRFIALMNGCEKLPNWFLKFVESEAYDEGHSSGYMEVFSIFENMILAAKEKLERYGSN